MKIELTKFLYSTFLFDYANNLWYQPYYGVNRLRESDSPLELLLKKDTLISYQTGKITDLINSHKILIDDIEPLLSNLLLVNKPTNYEMVTRRYQASLKRDTKCLPNSNWANIIIKAKEFYKLNPIKMEQNIAKKAINAGALFNNIPKGHTFFNTWTEENLLNVKGDEKLVFGLRERLVRERHNDVYIEDIYVNYSKLTPIKLTKDYDKLSINTRDNLYVPLVTKATVNKMFKKLSNRKFLQFVYLTFSASYFTDEWLFSSNISDQYETLLKRAGVSKPRTSKKVKKEFKEPNKENKRLALLKKKFSLNNAVLPKTSIKAVLDSAKELKHEGHCNVLLDNHKAFKPSKKHQFGASTRSTRKASTVKELKVDKYVDYLERRTASTIKQAQSLADKPKVKVPVVVIDKPFVGSVKGGKGKDTFVKTKINTYAYIGLEKDFEKAKRVNILINYFTKNRRSLNLENAKALEEAYLLRSELRVNSANNSIELDNLKSKIKDLLPKQYDVIHQVTLDYLRSELDSINSETKLVEIKGDTKNKSNNRHHLNVCQEESHAINYNDGWSEIGFKTAELANEFINVSCSPTANSKYLKVAEAGCPVTVGSLFSVRYKLKRNKNYKAVIKREKKSMNYVVFEKKGTPKLAKNPNLRLTEDRKLVCITNGKTVFRVTSLDAKKAMHKFKDLNYTTKLKWKEAKRNGNVSYNANIWDSSKPASLARYQEHMKSVESEDAYRRGSRKAKYMRRDAKLAENKLKSAWKQSVEEEFFNKDSEYNATLTELSLKGGRHIAKSDNYQVTTENKVTRVRKLKTGKEVPAKSTYNREAELMNILKTSGRISKKRSRRTPHNIVPEFLKRGLKQTKAENHQKRLNKHKSHKLAA